MGEGCKDGNPHLLVGVEAREIAGWLNVPTKCFHGRSGSRYALKPAYETTGAGPLPALQFMTSPELSDDWPGQFGRRNNSGRKKNKNNN